MATKYANGSGSDYYDSLLEEESLLTEDLAHFGNVKNEFVIFGKLASYGLLREGRLEESIQVCNQVLAIDPRNEEMNRLKERLTRFQNTANGSQLIKEEFIKHSTESPIRKLRRSVSEIKSKKSTSLENGVSVVSNGGEYHTSKMRHTITNGTGAVATPDEGKGTPSSVKLGRSQSLGGTKRAKSTSVLQKIQQFEQAAERRSSTSSANPRVERRISRKPSEDTVVEGEVVTSSRPDSGFFSGRSLDNSIEIVPVHIKQEVVTPSRPDFSFCCSARNANTDNSTQIAPVQIKREKMSPVPEDAQNARNGQAQPKSLQSPSPSPVRKPAHFSFSLPQENGNGTPHSEVKQKPPRSPTAVAVVRSNSITKHSQAFERRDSLNSASKVIITRKARPDCSAEWTDKGTKTFSDAIITQLELEFFNSDLILRGCILSPEGNILGLTAGFRIRHYEIQTLLAGMVDAAFLTSSRVTIGGIQFSCLSGTHSVVRGRIRNRGINCTKYKPIAASFTSQATNSRLSSSNFAKEGGLTIVVMYEHPVLPKQIAMLVQSVGNILESQVVN